MNIPEGYAGKTLNEAEFNVIYNNLAENGNLSDKDWRSAETREEIEAWKKNFFDVGEANRKFMGYDD